MNSSPGSFVGRPVPPHRPMLARRCAAAALLFVCGASFATCPPAATSRETLVALKQGDWKIADDVRRQALAIELLDCLGAADPLLRDELAFDALAHWARGGLLAAPTLQSMRSMLVARLGPEGRDRDGFAQPFAALALAEVARADRLAPFLSGEERAGLVVAATGYVAGVRDYRGFDAREGWRHGVAHGADLLLQLALNPALTRAQIDAVLAAIAAQVMPDGHFYIYGEGDRLMAPVFYIGRRGDLAGADWSAWFTALSGQRKKTLPATQASLAANHDLAAFLLPLYASLRESGTAEMQARMLPAVAAAIKTLD
jgi:hypothetical protein